MDPSYRGSGIGASPGLNCDHMRVPAAGTELSHPSDCIKVEHIGQETCYFAGRLRSYQALRVGYQAAAGPSWLGGIPASHIHLILNRCRTGEN